MNKATTENYWLLAAGFVNLITFGIHLFLGQLDLINPLEQSSLSNQITTELVSVWHMISLILLLTSISLIFAGFKYSKTNDILYKGISSYYILSGVVFILVGIIKSTFAPQWILLIPIGVLGFLGTRK